MLFAKNKTYLTIVIKIFNAILAYTLCGNTKKYRILKNKILKII